MEEYLGGLVIYDKLVFSNRVGDWHLRRYRMVCSDVDMLGLSKFEAAAGHVT